MSLTTTDTATGICQYGTVTVTLDGTPPGINLPASTSFPSSTLQLDVPFGETATLAVVLTGSPTPTIKWQELVDVVSLLARSSEEWIGLKHPTVEGVDEQWLMERSLATFESCNATANITSDCSEWVDIAGATSTFYTTPIGNSTLNGTIVRFVASNPKGTFISSGVTLVVGGTYINEVVCSEILIVFSQSQLLLIIRLRQQEGVEEVATLG